MLIKQGCKIGIMENVGAFSSSFLFNMAQRAQAAVD
jgi:hypothetical protein